MTIRVPKPSMVGLPLTEAERRVAMLCAEDLADKQIADRLGLSIKTIHIHMTRARRKLGVRSKVGVALWAAKQEVQP